MQRNGKRRKIIEAEAANNTSHPFEYPELRHELYKFLPATTAGKLSLLSKEWQHTTANERVNTKQLVLQIIYAKINSESDHPTNEFNLLTQTLFRKNKAILELEAKKPEEIINPWEKLLAHLVYQKPIEAEIIFKLLPELEPNQAVRLGYSLDVSTFKSSGAWDNLITFLFSAYNQKNLKTTTDKIQFTIAELKNIPNDHLANLLIACLSPILYALNKDWENFKKTQNTTCYRNLVEIDFTNINLENINLCGSDLYKSDFSNAIIKKGLFIHTFCYYVKFNETMAEESKFIAANLYYISAVKANFNKADLSYASMVSANLKETILTEAIMINVRAMGATFENTILRKANLSYANLDNAEIDHCDFSDAILDGASVCNVDLSNSILTNVNCHKTLFFGSKVPKNEMAHLRQNGAFLTLADIIYKASDAEISDELFAKNLREYIDLYIKLINPENTIPSTNYQVIIDVIKQYKNDSTTIKKLSDWLYKNRQRPRITRFHHPSTFVPKSYTLIQEIHEAYVLLEKRRILLSDKMDAECRHQPN